MPGKNFFDPPPNIFGRNSGQKNFLLQGIIDFRRAILADTHPQLKGASFAPGAAMHPNREYLQLNPLSGDAPYFSILLCLTPDDFTRQGESAGT